MHKFVTARKQDLILEFLYTSEDPGFKTVALFVSFTRKVRMETMLHCCYRLFKVGNNFQSFPCLTVLPPNMWEDPKSNRFLFLTFLRCSCLICLKKFFFCYVNKCYCWYHAENSKVEALAHCFICSVFLSVKGSFLYEVQSFFLSPSFPKSSAFSFCDLKQAFERTGEDTL